MISEQIEQLDISIKQSQKFVDIGDALERLYMNKDFKKLISEGYFETEAIRLVHLKADPNMQSADTQKGILQQMDAIGALKQYFHLQRYRAESAGKAITFDEQTREDILAEGNQA